MLIIKGFNVEFLFGVRKTGMVRRGFANRTASESHYSSTGYYMTLVQSATGSLIAGT